MLNLIIPACGKSTRFPNLRPKWLLTHPLGTSMLQESISGLDLTNVVRIVAVVLKQHVDEYQFVDAISQSINDDRFEFVVLDKPTDSQPETIAKAIKKAKIEGAICCKDSDNFFKADISSHVTPINFVGAIDLRKIGRIDAGNKSYVLTDNKNNIVNIAEKDVISNTFCCGLYGFESAEKYLKYYDSIKDRNDIYVSHVIHSMLLAGENFKFEEADDFVDWGTLEDWNKFRNQYKTLFVDIDGVIVGASSNYMHPFLGKTEGLKENIDALNKLYDTGKVTVVMTTARFERYRELTEDQLEKEGLKYHSLIMGLPHAKRIVINDFAASNPYPSCEAINLPRNADCLKEFI